VKVGKQGREERMTPFEVGNDHGSQSHEIDRAESAGRGLPHKGMQIGNRIDKGCRLARRSAGARAFLATASMRGLSSPSQPSSGADSSAPVSSPMSKASRSSLSGADAACALPIASTRFRKPRTCEGSLPPKLLRDSTEASERRRRPEMKLANIVDVAKRLNAAIKMLDNGEAVRRARDGRSGS
jgi:hypothetical protein